MTSSPVDQAEQSERVRAYLARVVPDCELTSEPLASGHAPVILMWMAHRMAGFAFSNGDADKSYTTLFGRFKHYYKENRGQLDSLDLSFVFCVRPDLPKLEEFCSAVETDVYFCRKFVVPLASNLDRSFGRLPFVPLTSGSGQLQRPPSAQTFMQQSGVPATLARYLAVPHQRGAANIAKECLDEASSWTPVLAVSGRQREAETQQEREDARVRLEAITIQNFRAYRKPQVFDLSGAVTVLYGPNGFGKTSLFDAIDFAATGGVGRLRLSASTDRFAKAVAHLDSAPRDSIVSLDFASNGTTKRISRRVASRAQAVLDGSTYDRKRTLVRFTGGGLTAADRIEHLVSLFRATHLFSQEHQELAKEFHRDCALPPHVVSHMLAFDDYANARNKAAEVCDVLEEWLRRERDNVEVLGRQVTDAEFALKSVEKAGEQYGQVARPVDSLASLRRRVQQAGLSIPKEEADRAFVRACRAAIQGRLADGEARMRRVTELLEEVRLLPGVVEGLAELMKRRHRTEGDLRSVGSALEKAEDEQAKARDRVREFENARSGGRERVEVLRWARETQPRYAALLRLEGQQAEAVQEASRGLARLRERRSTATRELRGEEQAGAGLMGELARIRESVARVEELSTRHEAWKADSEGAAELKAQERSEASRLEDLARREGALAAALEGKHTALGGMQQQLEEIERDQTELAGWLARVQEHIQDAHCPLCGHDHGSLERLQRKVEERRSVDGAVGLRSELMRLREETKELERRRADARGHVAAQRAAVQEAEKGRAARQSRMAAFEEDLAAMGLSAGAPAEVMRGIEERRAQGKQRIQEAERRSADLQATIEKSKATIAELDSAIEAGQKALVDRERELDECRGEIRRLRADRRMDQVALDTEASQLEEASDRQGIELRRIELAVSEAVEVAKERSAAANTLRERVAALRSSLDGLKKDIATRRRTVAETNAQLAESGLGVGAGEDEVGRLLEKETRARGQLAELRDFADSVEVAMDTAMTAAALKHQRREIREKEHLIEEAMRNIERYESWRKYFAEVIERVAGRQNAAVASFADEYGPTASAIQQRLRSVYGFQGIDTRSYESTIRVRVKRGDETLRPTDYFSDSQQRTLLLGLFLTACISQTWSSLSTVLLDDPIMHFDDLNTYAFLDMVAGLLSADAGPEQFVISTCDQKVLQLARSRFRHLGADARFYGFSAIGLDGPIVEEMASD